MGKMKTDLPPMNWVRTFEVAARLLNFSAAARELNMTQSAVSQQIKLLEHHLGEPLFVRKHKKVSLTNSGLAYLPVVQGILNNLQRKTADIFSPVGEGRLVLNVNYAFSSLWLSQHINTFCARYPGIRLQLIHSNWEREFSESRYDLSIMNGNGRWPGLSLEPLLKAEVKAFCSPQVAHLVHTPKDFLALPLIDIMGSSHSWSLWFERMGVDMSDANVICHKVDTLAAAYQMVKCGLGVMLAYPDFIAQEEPDKRLIAPIEEALPSEDNYFLAFPEGKPLSKSAMVFRDWLFTELGKVTPPNHH
ncbi:LysR substrate-binding domain-containing protein [Marinomonas pollencensis]|uniref:LysR family glycine cleavage system transcriptional activator n=1 Tax=Marinomonas pollencensis TaxID=491954 RepID=A0A3E0DQF4_9GAMM|nr:LysR substrate-binding domain-containing protein [Marinomonas pollencensis]REG85043.1 LysR family glycine cleavage system transcriptional activator [Marinomonas pollencensis]